MPGGGYREKSGRSKQGHYKGLYCGSTYELCWAIHALDHGIRFSRFPGQLKKDKLIYIPDFLLADGKTIIEPKGYERGDSVAQKTALAESLGYVVKIMKKDDLKYAFDYVSEKYNTKNFQSLYDDYKPKYTYVCGFCTKEFNKDKKIKTEKKFCDRICSGKYRFNKNQEKMLSAPKKNNKGQFGYGQIIYKNQERKLTKDQALYIFNAENKTLNELSKEFNVHKSTIWFIKQRKRYDWIHENNDVPPCTKKYASVHEYKSEKMNERLDIVKNLIQSYKESLTKFKSSNELAIRIANEVFLIQNKPISRETLLTREPYKEIVKNYIQEQSNF